MEILPELVHLALLGKKIVCYIFIYCVTAHCAVCTVIRRHTCWHIENETCYADRAIESFWHDFIISIDYCSECWLCCTLECSVEHYHPSCCNGQCWSCPNLIARSVHAACLFLLHCVPKNIPSIFGCNLKINCQILIILVGIFLTQRAIKWPFSFPSHSMYASALPRESRSSKICIEINRKPEKTSPKLSIVTKRKNSRF